jgi:hypothetical protein
LGRENFADNRPRAHLQPTSNGKLGPGNIGNIIIHSFSDASHSEIHRLRESLGPTSEVLAGYLVPMSVKYIVRIEQNVHIFGRDKLLSDRQSAALLNATKDQVRSQFRAPCLRNKERNQTKLILFFFKPVPLFEVPEDSTLSVEIVRVTK